MKISLGNVVVSNTLYEIIFFYVSEVGAYKANTPLQKRFCDFSQRGYIFGFF